MKFGADKLFAMVDNSKVVKEQCTLINQYISRLLIK